jgi:subtilase family serine protease
MLLRAMLLQAFYSVRSERQLMERLEFDLLFRWFVGLGIDDAVWDHSTFSKNRDRLLEAEVANVGRGDAAASQVTLVYRRSGHVLEREVAVRALRAGESAWVMLEAPGALGPEVGVILSVDAAGRIAEADERNNSRVFH